MIVPDGLADIVRSSAAGAVDIAALCERCEGAWPGSVRGILEDMASNVDAVRLIAGVGSPAARRPTRDGRLPLPHPLDADWRFTRESASAILNMLTEAVGPDDKILLVGMPTIALAAQDRGMVRRIAIASRRNDPLDNALRIAVPDATYVVIGEPWGDRFKAIAIDPPWYDNVALPLVRFGMALSDIDAAVFLCGPDRFTNPSSAQLLKNVTSRPRPFGFVNAEVVLRVRYETPFFELRCLAASGMTNVSPHWRTGLFHRCVPIRNTRVPVIRADAAPASWSEIARDGNRIWIRTPPSTSRRGDAVIGISTSISRLDPERACADLWTSGNTVASRLGGPNIETLAEALAAPKAGHWSQALVDALKEEAVAAASAVAVV